MLSALAQALVAALVVVLLVQGARSVLAELRALGLAPGFAFLEDAAGFRIAEGPGLDTGATYGRAFLVGLANTLRVSVAGIVLATLVGLAVALARLSGNPLAAPVARGYISLFRNTPLIVQLIFWYQGVFLRLPALGSSIRIGEGVGGPESALALMSQRGVSVAWLRGTDSLATFLALGTVALVAALILARRRGQLRDATGKPARTILTLSTVLAIGLPLAWLLAPEAPLRLDVPSVARFRYAGGFQLSPEYAALLVGLVAYTGAFIAEVIRSGIQAVGRGQREAALALGLSQWQVLRQVVLPQALRVLIPPLTSQYLNLTKNSSLGIAVGFLDLFNVSQTIINQTGQTVMVVALVMGVYLAISLTTSVAMNLYGRRVALVER